MFHLRKLSKYLHISNKIITCPCTFRNYGRIKQINITLVFPDGLKRILKGDINTSLLDVIRDNLVMEDYGVCGGSPACTTCHVILKPEDYERIEKQPELQEKQLLQCALDVTPTSRLGCQLELCESMDGIEIYLPFRKCDIRDC